MVVSQAIFDFLSDNSLITFEFGGPDFIFPFLSREDDFDLVLYNFCCEGLVFPLGRDFGSAAAGTGNNIPFVTNFGTPAAAVPTPALLPGLIGMGVAAIRKHRLAQPEDA